MMQLSISKSLYIYAASIYGSDTSHIDSFCFLISSNDKALQVGKVLCDEPMGLLHICHDLMKRPSIFDIPPFQNFSMRLPYVFGRIPMHHGRHTRYQAV